MKYNLGEVILKLFQNESLNGIDKHDRIVLPTPANLQSSRDALGFHLELVGEDNEIYKMNLLVYNVLKLFLILNLFFFAFVDILFFLKILIFLMIYLFV